MFRRNPGFEQTLERTLCVSRNCLVEAAKAATCATAASNQQATTLTHVLALNVEIHLENFMLISNEEHIEPIVVPKPV